MIMANFIDLGGNSYILFDLWRGYIMWGGWASVIVLGAALSAAAALGGIFAALVRR